MIYLYEKQHRKTGLKYFGKTTKPSVESYKGSGTYWLNHLRVHGNDIDTNHVWEFVDADECERFALKYSEENDIVNSKAYANLQPENGRDGVVVGSVPWNAGVIGTFEASEASKKAAQTRKDRGYVRPAESNQKIAAANRGKKRSPEFCLMMSERVKESNRQKSPEVKAAAVAKWRAAMEKRGFAISDETRKKRSEALRGKVRTPEQRKRMSEAKLKQHAEKGVWSRTEQGRKQMAENRRGKPHSAETRAKMKESQQKRRLAEQSR